MTKRNKTKVEKNTRTEDLPATVGLVNAVREELKEMIKGTKLHLESQMVSMKSGLESKMVSMESRLESQMVSMKSGLESKMVSMESRLDARISEVKADVSVLRVDVATVKADISAVKEMVHQQTILVEEMRSNNNAVLDGLKLHAEQIENLKKRDAEHEATLRMLVSSLLKQPRTV